MFHIIAQVSIIELHAYLHIIGDIYIAVVVVRAPLHGPRYHHLNFQVYRAVKYIKIKQVTVMNRRGPGL